MEQERSTWPDLRYETWRETAATLQLWTQVIGKVRLGLAPWVNHSWQVPLYVTARGLTTSPMPFAGEILELEFDFVHHRLLGRTSRAEELEHCHVGRQPRGEGCRAGSTLEARHARFQRRTVRGALAAVAVASRVVPIHVALEGRAEEDRLGHGARRRVGRVRGVDTERVETRRLAHTLSRPSSRRSAARSDSAPLTLHYGFADSLRRRAMEVSHGARAQHVAGSQV